MKPSPPRIIVRFYPAAKAFLKIAMCFVADKRKWQAPKRLPLHSIAFSFLLVNELQSQLNTSCAL